jgi:hypothetical protein
MLGETRAKRQAAEISANFSTGSVTIQVKTIVKLRLYTLHCSVISKFVIQAD